MCGGLLLSYFLANGHDLQACRPRILSVGQREGYGECPMTCLYRLVLPKPVNQRTDRSVSSLRPGKEGKPDLLGHLISFFRPPAVDRNPCSRLGDVGRE